MNKTMGIFDTVAEAIAAAQAAQKDLVKNYTLEDRDRMINKIAEVFMGDIETFAQMEFDETGYGRVSHKIAKTMNPLLTHETTAAIPTNMYASDKGLTVEYWAPFGVIGAVTPVTNPIATIMSNSINMIIGGNAVIFNPHPASVECSSYTVVTLNEAIVAAGGPENLVVMVKDPTMKTLDEIMAHPAVKLLVGTGGPAMCHTLQISGKKCICAGAGNPPSIVDETADIPKAAAGIYGSASFDNNLLCIAEKEIFVVDAVYDQFMEELVKVGAYRMNAEETEKVTKLVCVPDKTGKLVTNKNYVGHMANVIMRDAGCPIDSDPFICVFDAEFEHPLVMIEQMLPIIPVVRCKDFAEAMERAIAAERDCKHSASIWSQSIDHVTAFGKVINTTVFVQNGGTMAAFGNGGSGTGSPTIATPTGEGITGPQSFVRRRRFCMAGGGNYLL